MEKQFEKDFMRRRVNVTPALLRHWQDLFKLNHRNILHESLLEMEHLGQTFEYQGRTFELIGMTIASNMMIREIIDGAPSAYWECTRAFVQRSFGIFNEVNRKGVWEIKPYSKDSMFLPPIQKIHHLQKKKAIENEQKERDEPEMVEFQEDGHEEESFD